MDVIRTDWLSNLEYLGASMVNCRLASTARNLDTVLYTMQTITRGRWPARTAEIRRWPKVPGQHAVLVWYRT